jgi:hypothetical protein
VFVLFQFKMIFNFIQWFVSDADSILLKAWLCNLPFSKLMGKKLCGFTYPILSFSNFPVWP